VQLNGTNQSTDELLLKQLKSILLEEDRVALSRVEAILDSPEALSDRISPIMEQRLEDFKKTFPKEYKVFVDKLVQDHIKNSQEQIVEVIFPVLGSMVRKYIDLQFQILKESIEERINAMQDKMNFWKKFKSKLSPNSSVTAAELIIASTDVPRVKEIYLVERDSGLLLAHASLDENFDKDAIAGMLTAIKAFVEDAFKQEKEQLDSITYDHYKILIQNYRHYYMAAMIEGSISTKERVEISEKLYNFILSEYVILQQQDQGDRYEHISGLLKERFLKVDFLTIVS
jgi:uncharacterized protein YutE (UPF0331/DUF86 family)